MIFAGTGHRPVKLGGHGMDAQRALVDFAMRQIAARRPQGVVSGMALGWDQALAEACVRLNVPYVAAVPFMGQESRWPNRAQKRYWGLIAAADHTVSVCSKEQVEESGVEWAMQARNEWMVDNSGGVLALWNGDREGGTFNCIEYARQGRREIVNVWPEWSDWWDGGMYLV